VPAHGLVAGSARADLMKVATRTGWPLFDRWRCSRPHNHRRRPLAQGSERPLRFFALSPSGLGAPSYGHGDAGQEADTRNYDVGPGRTQPIAQAMKPAGRWPTRAGCLCRVPGSVGLPLNSCRSEASLCDTRYVPLCGSLLLTLDNHK
jgi:hypothetical protein